MNENQNLLSLTTALVVEDDSRLRRRITSYLESLGAMVHAADSLQVAKDILQKEELDFALMDVHLPDGNGLDLLDAVSDSTGAVIMTAEGGMETVVRAMQLGAQDYLAKPFDLKELPIVFRRIQKQQRTQRVEARRVEERKEASGGVLFGKSLEPLKRQLEKILEADRRLQTAPPPVLLLGETGSGKTSFARWIHQNGPRSSAPFIELNCSALPENLVEAELFGAEKGAFTDARSARIGLFEAADGGTLFLDELSSLPVQLQAKVLTAIEDLKIRRLGSHREIKVDVRLIAASNQDLTELIQRGEFREDLYHRLDLFRLVLPPLRERKEDLQELAEYYIEKICRKHHLPRRTLSSTALQKIQAHSWPGNIRELTHELERAVVLEEGDELELSCLSVPGIQGDSSSSVAGQNSSDLSSRESIAKNGDDDWWNANYVFPESGFDMESAILRIIRSALDQAHGNVTAAARLLGVNRDYIRYRLKSDKP